MPGRCALLAAFRRDVRLPPVCCPPANRDPNGEAQAVRDREIKSTGCPCNQPFGGKADDDAQCHPQPEEDRKVPLRQAPRQPYLLSCHSPCAGVALDFGWPAEVGPASCPRLPARPGPPRHSSVRPIRRGRRRHSPLSWVRPERYSCLSIDGPFHIGQLGLAAFFLGFFLCPARFP